LGSNSQRNTENKSPQKTHQIDRMKLCLLVAALVASTTDALTLNNKKIMQAATRRQDLERQPAESMQAATKRIKIFRDRTRQAINHTLSLLAATGAPELDPPSNQPYALAADHALTYSQWKQDLILMPILKQLGKGFFVESGALDGETHSNTVLLEKDLGWSGLLVEPDPRFFDKILSKHRHAYAFNGCLAPSGRAGNVSFSFHVPFGLSQIRDGGSLAVQAQPLEALMKAAGRNVVDFWSLDIEGSEGPVLKTTDFSKVEVGVLLIEMNKGEQNNKEIREVMNREGFQEIGHTNYDGGILDYIFINPKYFQKRNLPVPTPNVFGPENR